MGKQKRKTKSYSSLVFSSVMTVTSKMQQAVRDSKLPGSDGTEGDLCKSPGYVHTNC